MVKRKAKENRNYWKEYRWSLSFLKPYKINILLIVISGLFLTLGQVIVPKAFQFLIDDMLPNQDMRGFSWLMVIVIFTIVVMIIATGVKNMQQRIIREKAGRDLQYASFEKLRTLGFNYVEKTPNGEILSLLNTDVHDVQKIYRQHFPNIVSHGIMVIGLGTILLFMNYQLTLLIIPCYLMYYLFGPWIERRAFIYLKKFNEERVGLEKHVYETMSGMQELRAYHALKWRRKTFLHQIKEFNHSWVVSIFYAHSRGSIRRITVYFAVLLLFWFGSLQVQEGALSVGEFVAFFFYFMRLMFSITYLVTDFTEQQTLMIQASRLYEFYHQPIEITEKKAPSQLEKAEGTIEFTNVSFSYREAFPILKKLSLRIESGENIAIVGESGSGKSTLIKLIGRFYDPDAGEIFLDNHPIQNLSFEQLRGHLGYVFQEGYLFGTSVRENIRFGNPAATDEQVEEAAAKAYAHDFITTLPEGYDTLVGERGYKLSGGQKQRIAIARMFIKNPRIVLLDEATSALDNESEMYVHQALKQLSHNRTTITIAHRISTIEDADRILVLKDGRIVEQCTYAQLLGIRGEFYNLVHSSKEVANHV